jgi:hypothetical protein
MTRRTELDVILGAMWTVVALDVSLSMPMRDYWVAAHQDAVALVERLHKPESSDQLRAVIAFSELARSIEIADLASLEFDHMYGSNIAAALDLALAELNGEPGRVVIISDMEATAHITDDGHSFFSYPPAPETAKRTIQALDDCSSARTQLAVRRYRSESQEGESGVNALIREVTRRGGHVTEVVLPATIRLPDIPDALPRPRPPRQPRARRFPDEYLYSAPLPPGEQNLYLSYDDQRLIGVVDWMAVDVSWDRRQGANGIFAGSEMSAGWRLKYSSAEPADIDASLRGHFGDQVVTLSGQFHLDDYHTIDRASISGQIDGQAILATVEALDGGLDHGHGRTVAVEGRFAGTSLALVATVSADCRNGTVRGSIDSIPVQIDAARPPGSTRRDRGRLRVTGTYQGPPALLAVIVGTLLRFN